MGLTSWQFEQFEMKLGTGAPNARISRIGRRECPFKRLFENSPDLFNRPVDDPPAP